MIGYEEARKIARSHFETRGGLTLTKAFDAEGLWIFNARKDGALCYGGGSISVDKETGEVAPFRIQVGDNFELLHSAREMEL